MINFLILSRFLEAIQKFNVVDSKNIVLVKRDKKER